MKKLFFVGVFFVLCGVGIVAYGQWAQNKQNVLDEARWRETKDAKRYNVFIDRFNNASTKIAYEALEKELVTLPKQYQDVLSSQIKLRVAVLNFEEAQELLDRARALHASLSLPAPPPEKVQTGVDSMGQPIYKIDQLPPSKPHSSVLELLDKSMVLYNNSKREVDRLAEVKGDVDYNFRLNYVKGEVYHRYTQLFATQETARELFNQTVTYYKHALRYKPADTNTVINIELLIRDEQGMTGGAGQPDQQKSKLLNQTPGSGSSKGN